MTSGLVQSAGLSALPTVRHGFFGRTTEAGDDLNVSLKLASSPEAAEAARVRAAALVAPGLTPCTLTQVHSNTVVSLDAPLAGHPEADGMVTRTPGLALGIITADCAPVLFADPKTGVIGAAHAGWRGAVTGIVAKTVAAMQALGAAPVDIVAAIGPAISFANYEIGDDLAREIAAINPLAKNRIGVPPTGAKPHFDVPGFLRDDLARAGITHIEQVGGCTYAQPHSYYSHRFFTHHGGPQGRQIALIALVQEI